MIKSIEEMYIWQMSRSLVNDVYKMMSVCKDYGFKDQIQRAVISIMNNIAEGLDSGSTARFIFHLKFLEVVVLRLVRCCIYVKILICAIKQHELSFKTKLNISHRVVLR